MIVRGVLAALISLSLLSCGVKSDLGPPMGVQTDKRQPDPSKPPQPIGQ
jgi:hypothetical protein